MAQPPTLHERSLSGDRFLLWLAQGFGIGRIPFAPGTWGSLLGVPLTALLLGTGSVWAALALWLFSCALSVYACGRAEIVLKQTDPGSVVLDEIVAIPLCFALWLGVEFGRLGHLPGPTWLFQPNHWLGVMAIFALFRLFDIWKPWPVKQSQHLPGGWGVTTDDLLAALYVNGVTFFFVA
jgi:phosphatidylglycerophosphatase A